MEVDPQELKAAADGINEVVGELKDLGIDESGEVGRGFSMLELTGLQMGTTGLREAFDDFCDRWSWGVRALVQDANAIAQTLGLNAGLYHDTEQYASNTLKGLVSDAMGNPHLTDDQVHQQSWGQVFSDNTFNDYLHPDYSAQSSLQASSRIQQDAHAAAEDLHLPTGDDAKQDGQR